MFNEALKLVCIYLIAFGLLLILIELRVHLDESFLLFGLFLIGMSVFAAVDFWQVVPAPSGAIQRFWLTLQHLLVFGCAVLLLWYLVLLSDTQRRRPIVYASAGAGMFGVIFALGPFFRVEAAYTVPTLLYLLTVPLFILIFSSLNLFLIIRGLRSQLSIQRKRVLKFHLVGFCLLVLCGIYDFVIFSTRLEPFAHVLPNGTIIGLALYGGVSSIILTDRLVDLVAEKNQYSRLADSDALTHTGNRRMLSTLLAQGLGIADRSGQPFSAIVLDIDSFKTYNDTYGHPVGDEILREVAEQLRASLRPADSLLRYGGDEFVVLCPNTSAEAVSAIGERICTRLRDATFSIHGHILCVTVSVGCATYPTHTTEHDQLVTLADRALYASKQNGKNRVTSGGALPIAAEIHP